MKQGGNSSTELSIVPIDSEKPKQVNLYQMAVRKSRWEDGDSFRASKRNSELVNTSKGIQYSRWSIDKTFTPPPLTHIPEFLTKDQLELILRQARIEDISRRLTANDYEIQDIEIRSPSPEPIYDPKTGQRVNTRESRAKEKLLKERNLCIEECLKIDPQYKPPPDYKPPKAMRKLYIPQYGTAPPQSYVTLILGPRGKTQKALEKKTNCKIYIRGKGASRGKNYNFESEEEPMHVLIVSDSEHDLEKCVSILEPILNGHLDDEENKKNRYELMRLGAENRLSIGYKTDWCDLCGEQGHKRYCCPSRPLALGWNQQCEICNEKTHFTEDCSTKKRKKKSIEEQLEELNRISGTNMQLSPNDIMMIKAYKVQQKAMKQSQVDEIPETIVEEEDLLPPGVDPKY